MNAKSKRSRHTWRDSDDAPEITAEWAAKADLYEGFAPTTVKETAMPIDIDQLTESELIDLNHRIVARLQFLRQLAAHSTMLEFRIGERVTFHPDGRPPVTGMITRYNKKTVSIVTDDGQRWNVAPNFLERATPRPRDLSDGSVVSIPEKR